MPSASTASIWYDMSRVTGGNDPVSLAPAISSGTRRGAPFSVSVDPSTSAASVGAWSSVIVSSTREPSMAWMFPPFTTSRGRRV